MKPTGWPHTVRRLADSAGCFAMVALDHRESLRTMMRAEPGAQPVSDARVRAFKRAGVDVLAPHASAVLLDHEFGLLEDGTSGLPESTALILAADCYEQLPGGPVLSSTLNEKVTVDVIRTSGAAATKLLVHWHPDGGAEQRKELLGRFLDLNREAGTASIVEGIVRPPEAGWSSEAKKHRATIAAAAELCAANPDLYKAEVPGYVPGNLSAVAQWSRELTAAAARPWVVLSSGVRPADFQAAVSEACKGGAVGFLAGRAIWSDIATSQNPQMAFNTKALPKLKSLTKAAHQQTPPQT